MQKIGNFADKSLSEPKYKMLFLKSIEQPTVHFV